MPYFAPGILARARQNAPILEIWENGGAGAILFYPGSMLAPGHYCVLLAELFSAGFSVAGLHLSGHGECRAKGVFVFRELLAQGLEAEAWLRKAGFDKIVVCGHSQGGILALAHAAAVKTLTAAFAIGAVFPTMPDAIEITRFAPLRKQRDLLMTAIKWLAAIFPGLPVPLPFYLELGRIMAGRKKPLVMGKAKGRWTYPLRYLESLFDAEIAETVNCPLWLFSARDDALFTEDLTKAVFNKIKAQTKNLVWLAGGGHMAPLNPGIARHIARHAAAASAGLGLPLRLRSNHGWKT